MFSTKVKDEPQQIDQLQGSPGVGENVSDLSTRRSAASAIFGDPGRGRGEREEEEDIGDHKSKADHSSNCRVEAVVKKTE